MIILHALNYFLFTQLINIFKSPKKEKNTNNFLIKIIMYYLSLYNFLLLHLVFEINIYNNLKINVINKWCCFNNTLYKDIYIVWI